MRILLQSDSCFIPTGLARVGRELAIGLARRGHDIGYLGWFHRQDIFPNLPYNIKFWWTFNSRYGADVLDETINQFQPEVLLTIGDLWWLSYINDPNVCRTRRFFQWCNYTSVDGEPLSGGLPPAIIKAMEDVDIPVAYTEYAKKAILKSVSDQETRNRLQVIYHGVDTNIFHPDKEERIRLRKQFGLEDKFIFLIVCRNQSRKNIPEMFRAWKVFSELPEVKGKVVLWPHMYFNDPMGWKIDELLDVFGLRNQSVFYYNQVAYAPSEQHLIPDSELAALYRISDAMLLLSGEGFGLPTFEAMATKIPCILSDHSASGELGANGRAELIPVSGSLTWTGNHLTQRPLHDIDTIVSSLLRIFKNKDYRDDIALKGYEFAKKYTWDNVVDQWNHLFLSKEIPFIKPMQLEVIS